MALFFDPALGRVSQFIPRDTLTPAMLTFPGFDYATLQLITSSLSLSLKPVYQANDTLGDDVYLVSFGESITPLPISGLVFASACDFNGLTGQDGLLLLIEWWQQRNLLNRKEPVSLTIGSNYAVKAFISDLNITVANAEDGIWKFDMLLLRIPQRVLRTEEFAQQAAPQMQPFVNPQLGPDSGVPQFVIPPGFQVNPNSFAGNTAAENAAASAEALAILQAAANANRRTVTSRTDGAPTRIETVSISSSGYSRSQPLVGQLTQR